jgi:hypothetical protein
MASIRVVVIVSPFEFVFVVRLVDQEIGNSRTLAG